MCRSVPFAKAVGRFGEQTDEESGLDKSFLFAKKA